MDLSKKVVTQLPLRELWRTGTPDTFARVGDIDEGGIRNLLRNGAVQFVVVDAGKAPTWIATEDCFKFWKSEIRPHLASPDQKVVLSEFPTEYCYFGSRWSKENSSIPVVVFDKCH